MLSLQAFLKQYMVLGIVVFFVLFILYYKIIGFGGGSSAETLEAAAGIVG